MRIFSIFFFFIYLPPPPFSFALVLPTDTSLLNSLLGPLFSLSLFWILLSFTDLSLHLIVSMMCVRCFVFLNPYWGIVSVHLFLRVRAKGDDPTIENRRRTSSPCRSLNSLRCPDPHFSPETQKWVMSKNRSRNRGAEWFYPSNNIFQNKNSTGNKVFQKKPWACFWSNFQKSFAWI